MSSRNFYLYPSTGPSRTQTSAPAPHHGGALFKSGHPHRRMPPPAFLETFRTPSGTHHLCRQLLRPVLRSEHPYDAQQRPHGCPPACNIYGWLMSRSFLPAMPPPGSMSRTAASQSLACRSADSRWTTESEALLLGAPLPAGYFSTLTLRRPTEEMEPRWAAARWKTVCSFCSWLRGRAASQPDKTWFPCAASRRDATTPPSPQVALCCAVPPFRLPAERPDALDAILRRLHLGTTCTVFIVKFYPGQ